MKSSTRILEQNIVRHLGPFCALAEEPDFLFRFYEPQFVHDVSSVNERDPTHEVPQCRSPITIAPSRSLHGICGNFGRCKSFLGHELRKEPHRVYFPWIIRISQDVIGQLTFLSNVVILKVWSHKEGWLLTGNYCCERTFRRNMREARSVKDPR